MKEKLYLLRTRTVLGLGTDRALASLASPAGSPTDSMLAKINARPQVMQPLTADDVYVLGVYLVNDQPWRDGARRIDPAAISQIPPLLMGKPMQLNHATNEADAMPVGCWFDASAVTAPDGTNWVATLGYLPKDDANTQLVGRVRAGVISEASISLLFGSYTCSICGGDMSDWSHEHMPGETYAEGTAYGVVGDIKDVPEASLVWSGMVEGTRIFMAAGRDVDAVDVAAAEEAARAPVRDRIAEYWESYELLDLDRYFASLGAIPYAETPKAPEGAAWDAGAEMGKATEPADWKRMCAWFDSEKPELKGSYKLPHHRGDGTHAVVWRGVAAAMGVLLGARGGADIPDGDRKAVFNHLRRHYLQFSKEPPSFE